MKIPRFLPRQYPDRLHSWCVDIPAYLSSTKRPERRYFLHYKEAREFGAHMRRVYDDHTHDTTYLSRDQIAEAARAYAVIADLSTTVDKPYSLLQIVEDFAEREKLKSKSVTLSNLFDQFLDARQDKSSVYLSQMNWCKSRLSRLEYRMVSTLTAADIEAVLRGDPPSSRNAHIRYLGVVLRWGVKKGYLADDRAVRNLELSPVKPQEVRIYSVDDVEKMLDDCLENDLELLPYRLLTIFCGVRPTGEMSRVRWEDLNWDDNVLKLHAGITKKGRTRFIYPAENAMQWLLEYKRRGGPTTGKIVPYGRGWLESKIKANCRRAGVRGLKNASRHSYCSYWLANGGKIDALTLQAGHRSTGVLWESYYQMATRQDAAKFWGLLPKTTATNIVAITA